MVVTGFTASGVPSRTSLNFLRGYIVGTAANYFGDY